MIKHDKWVARNVGKILAFKRIELGLSQRDLAKRLKISHQRVCDIENSGNNLAIETIKKYSYALGYAVEIKALNKKNLHVNI